MIDQFCAPRGTMSHERGYDVGILLRRVLLFIDWLGRYGVILVSEICLHTPFLLPCCLIHCLVLPRYCLTCAAESLLPLPDTDSWRCPLQADWGVQLFEVKLFQLEVIRGESFMGFFIGFQQLLLLAHHHFFFLSLALFVLCGHRRDSIGHGTAPPDDTMWEHQQIMHGIIS